MGIDNRPGPPSLFEITPEPQDGGPDPKIGSRTFGEVLGYVFALDVLSGRYCFCRFHPPRGKAFGLHPGANADEITFVGLDGVERTFVIMTLATCSFRCNGDTRITVHLGSLLKDVLRPATRHTMILYSQGGASVHSIYCVRRE